MTSRLKVGIILVVVAVAVTVAIVLYRGGLSVTYNYNQTSAVVENNFIFGFVQAAGGYKGYTDASGNKIDKNPWTLTDEELGILKNDFKVNAIRFFAHPYLIGIPQESWVGPMSIKYTDYSEDQFVWDRPETPQADSLFEIIRMLKKHDIKPIILVMPVSEYIVYMNRTDLTFLNGTATGYYDKKLTLDYAGINPEEQVAYLSNMIAKHVNQSFGDNFGMIYTELCGVGDGAVRKLNDGEKAKWARIVAGIKTEAPGALVLSPELCGSVWWWTPARKQLAAGDKSCQIQYNSTPMIEEDSPKGLPVKAYADVFDAVATSVFDFDPFPCTNPSIRANSDTVLKIIRQYALAGAHKKWFWAEAGWGSESKNTTDRLHDSWALNLLAADNLAGMLIWQAKDNQRSGAGLWYENGEKTPTFDFIKKLTRVITDNTALVQQGLPLLNNDQFFVSANDFTENDAGVYTRRLGKHLIIYSTGPSSVTFENIGGRSMEVYANAAAPLALTNPSNSSLAVAGLIPHRVYVLAEYVPTPTPTPTPTRTPTATPTASVGATPTPTPTADPSLVEGDVITARNDIDVFIINQYNQKRLFLNPIIFSFYGHLGFAKVKSVSPATRDSYKTSGLFKNCETNDGKIWAVEVISEDRGILHHLDVSDIDPKKVFCINTSEFNWYPKSIVSYTNLNQVPVYGR